MADAVALLPPRVGVVDGRVLRPRGRANMRNRRSIFRFDPNGDPSINTTPLIDVMLVMLVMFIITIPPPTHTVELDLPIDGVAMDIQDTNRITVAPDNIVRWNGEVVDLAQLGSLVKTGAAREVKPVIELYPDAQARYLRVDQVIAAVKRNGGEKLNFVGNERYRNLI
jgi:biopolymer transport protein ExbD